MTAIVAVLNKHAVAVAADSAVTMGNTHKVVNSANKIFTLSKYNPVAVMTYNFKQDKRSVANRPRFVVMLFP